MQPLAERLRPKNLEDYIGQKHLLGENAPLRQFILSGNIPSFILWGPPGVGKTTLAKLIANYQNRHFFSLSAVSDGVKELREIIKEANQILSSGLINGQKMQPVLFIDEIHRFSKSQQDSLLNAVENGVITLIGATTENPSFEVISPLLSRCQVFVLQPLSDDDLQEIIKRAFTLDTYLSSLHVEIKETGSLIHFSGGDARKLLNNIEVIVNALQSLQQPLVITDKAVSEILRVNPLIYDKKGEYHYDIISAFIKSIRGSNPDAAIYWLARMIETGEDPLFIARRLIISASEDIGLANPNAVLIANTAFDSVQKIGWPEARIPLAMATVYLASSKKSNSAYMALEKAQAELKRSGNLPVPLHLRNAPTKLMKNLHYGEDYLYPHDFPNNFVKQQYLPDAIANKRFWEAQDNVNEKKMREWLDYLDQSTGGS